ncbi:DNA replication licensing factor MCM5, putative [Cryptosporidium muris RN66]|uniref:DNA replication licensing factor MCM5 n=1 Tax=Cryptosporidium muris (strain RN66) TaxID=441375 RepID=B6ABT1_CRYMR|nr:DNA replication licensing factor MCM5, putative [Cryptosporidium muris RN66]EEA05284.1 DNA replication licensing factor MCM5, putative [Cryptosporidium muris RN66]|eukprot:XP_002139633.1 DNA replication licensing factor MCM5 [Cryptosporidium muris RN66]
MLGVTSGAVYYGSAIIDGNQGTEWINENEGNVANSGLLTVEECRQKFNYFIRNFNLDGHYIYRERLISNVSIGNYSLIIETHHLTADDIAGSEMGAATADHTSIDDIQSQKDGTSGIGISRGVVSSTGLVQCFRRAPLRYIPICEQVLKEIYLDITGSVKNTSLELEMTFDSIPDIQLQLISNQEQTLIRDLKSGAMEKLVVVPGIIIQASRPQKKAIKLRIMCRQCKVIRTLNIPVWRQGVLLPRVCGTIPTSEAPKCPLDPFIILSDESEYIDIQSMKFQELPEHVPTGDIPRHITLHITRNLIDKAIPGNRLHVIGVLSSVEKETSSRGISSSGMSSIRSSYLHVLGLIGYKSSGELKFFNSPSNLVMSSLLSDRYNEIEEFRRLAATPNIQELIMRSIAPAIYGNVLIKQAIACLLFSGSAKTLPDGTKIRGDLNILLLGDPSTAKSQLLKFVEQAAPICIYTSGKGSSAAGLTAAIVRDHSNGVYALEGGAMVLADGGVVCIDEFDKMRDDDRVAIHEAMEQQTISIAKAGITTILKAQCSILAAANPSFGSYDETKDITQQHDFESTILSRFDLIFLLKDEKDITRDKLIASHIVDLHSGNMKDGLTFGAGNSNADDESILPLEKLQRYISFCRENIHPRLSLDAAAILENFYVQIREENRSNNSGNKITARRERIPITVRQLEAITRIAESLAKMEMQSIASERHIEMAIKLFTKATMEAIRSNILWIDNLSPSEQAAIVDAENAIKTRLPIKARASKGTVVKDLALVGFDPHYLSKAIKILVQKGDLIERSDYSIVRVR